MVSKRAVALMALSLIAIVPACKDTVIPPPPPPPPQATTLNSYYKTADNKGRQTGLPSNDVLSFLAVSNGEFWIGTSAGLAIYPNLDKNERTGFVNEINGLPHPEVRSLVEYAGKVYAGTWGGGVGVYDLTAGTWSIIAAKKNGLRNNFIADIEALQSEDRVYFATGSGVSIYNPTAGTFTSFIPPSLLDRLVSSVEIVSDGTNTQRWYGPRAETKITADSLQYHGITVSRTPGTVIKYTVKNSALPEPNVNDIYYDGVRQTFWVAMATQGLAEVNVAASTWTRSTTVEGLPSNTVYAITRAGTTIWAATQNGLAKQRSDGSWQGYNRSGGLQADRVRMLYSPDGDRLYLGFINGGAARVKTN